MTNTQRSSIELIAVVAGLFVIGYFMLFQPYWSQPAQSRTQSKTLIIEVYPGAAPLGEPASSP